MVSAAKLLAFCLLSAFTPSLQPQYRSRNTHVDPLLNQTRAILWRPVGEPDLNEAFRRISRSVIMTKIVFGLSIRGLLVVVNIHHSVYGDFKVRQISPIFLCRPLDHLPPFAKFLGGHAHGDITVS